MRKFNYSKKYFYLVLLVLFGIIFTYFGASYALFKKTDKLTDINFVAGELNYRITNSSLSNNSITVGAGSVHTLTLTLTSLNTTASKYELYYLVDGKKVANDSVVIGYTSGTTDAVKGTINANATKNVTIKIKNVSSKSVTITFGCEGGLSSNTLTMSKGLSLDRLITDSDIEIYYTYVGTGTAPSKFPSKNSGYYVKSLTCNGMTAQWNNATWSLTFSNVTGANIICSFQIDTAYLNSYVMSLADIGNSPEVRKDTHAATGNQNFATTEYRYWGPNPNNYVNFNGEAWRIIGAFDVDNGSGTVQKRVKIVRNSSIGTFSWDSSASTLNNGYGINEWSQSDIKTLLNGPYYNRTSGTCYNGASNATTSCNFTTTGLTSTARGMIGNAKWYLGATLSDDGALTATRYNSERSTNTGKSCTSSDGSGCNDTTTRTTTWVGQVGLMYPSDYGYSANMSVCAGTSLYNYKDGCMDTSWIYNGTAIWLLNPFRSSSSKVAYYVNSIPYDGSGNFGSAYSYLNVRPVVYLLPTIKLTGGSGTATDMYTISQ